MVYRHPPSQKCILPLSVIAKEVLRLNPKLPTGVLAGTCQITCKSLDLCLSLDDFSDTYIQPAIARLQAVDANDDLRVDREARDCCVFSNESMMVKATRIDPGHDDVTMKVDMKIKR